MPACMLLYLVHVWCLWGPVEDIRPPGTRVTDGYEAPCVCWGPSQFSVRVASVLNCLTNSFSDLQFIFPGWTRCDWKRPNDLFIIVYQSEAWLLDFNSVIFLKITFHLFVYLCGRGRWVQVWRLEDSLKEMLLSCHQEIELRSSGLAAIVWGHLASLSSVVFPENCAAFQVFSDTTF